jgi:orotidine-5'-phosphate decarboxylase
VTFGERLEAAFDEFGHLCVGIDPHASLLAEWGLPDSAAGVRDFGLQVVAAAERRVGIVKPQVGFFERHGSAGLAALEDVLAAARAAGLVIVGDAKRGDIGSTMDGYADAWLGAHSPLAVDTLTVSGYLGVGALDGAARLAQQNDRGVLVLAATSNPEALTVQTAVDSSGRTVAGGIVEEVGRWNSAVGSLGDCGVVIGATVDLAAAGISEQALHGMPVLAPGFGFQGTPLSAVRSVFGSAAGGVIMSVSRSVLAAGPAGLAAAVEAGAIEARKAYAA